MPVATPKGSCAVFRTSGVLADLSYRADMIGEVCDAANHSPQSETACAPRRLQSREPVLRFAPQSVANLFPLAVVHCGDLPCFAPVCTGERISAFSRPPVHQRQPVA